MEQNKHIYLCFYRYAFQCITLLLIKLLMFATVVLLIVSCEDKSIDAEPSVNLNHSHGFISGDTVIPPGEIMKFSISAHSENNVPLTNFLIKVYSDSTNVVYDTGIHAQNLNWQGAFTKSFAPQERWKFIIRDRYGNTDSREIIIEEDTGSNFRKLQSFENIKMGAQNNTSLGSLFSFTDGGIYDHSTVTNNVEIQKIIDLIYYYYGEDENVIASPGANVENGVFPGDFKDWDVRNTTRFIKTELSEEDFYNASNDSILIANYIEGEGKRKSKNLQSGDIFVFKTQQDLLGIYKVLEVIGTDQGTVLIDIKIQEEE